jgi:hypothetical protein
MDVTFTLMVVGWGEGQKEIVSIIDGKSTATFLKRHESCTPGNKLLWLPPSPGAEETSPISVGNNIHNWPHPTRILWHPKLPLAWANPVHSNSLSTATG